MKAKCKYYRKILGGDTSNGTSHLRNHKKVCVQKQIHDGSQKNLAVNFLSNGAVGNKYPTANLFFPRICDLKLKLIEWKLDSDPIIVAMAERMSAKFSKYWTDIHLLLTVAVVLDPAYKLELIDYYWVKFGCSDSSLEPDNVKASVYNLVREYQLKKQIRDQISLDNAGSSNGAGSDSRISEADLDYEIYLSRRKRVKTNSVCSELDHYLSEDVSPRAPNVSVLDWWRVNTGKYPLLQEVGRDLLAVPVTSVASESAFSSGGRLLDPHRSRLHFGTVEALMCTRSWIKDDLMKGNYYMLFFII
ncbi:Putative AC transposase [Linum grandiflorum]